MTATRRAPQRRLLWLLRIQLTTTLESTRRLDHAEDLAEQLGADGNFGWTAFGPTNVRIHRLSAAVVLDDPYRSLALAEDIDITGLPVGLCGRQAQYHLDSAWTHVQLGEDARAVIHLLEAERVADELVRANPGARALIQDLLSRELNALSLLCWRCTGWWTSGAD